MDFDPIGTAHGNLAGGIGKNEAACPSVRSRVTVDRRSGVDRCSGDAHLQPQRFCHRHPTFRFKVTDTVDLCPGNCGSDLGVINEQQATIPMSRLEASGVSGDVPFTVTSRPQVQAAFTVAPPAPPAPKDVTLSASSLFDFGSDVLRGDAAAALIAQLGDRPSRADLTQPFVVEGHTDSKGSGPRSIWDCRSVGPNGSRSSSSVASRTWSVTSPVSGLGSADPVAPTPARRNDNPEGRRLNRRVDLHFSAPSP